MKCKKSTGDCKLQIDLKTNGDVLEYCTVCDFSYLHKFENIKNNHLHPFKEQI